MTTVVRVEAHCSSDKEVVVTTGVGQVMQDVVLNNGDTHLGYVYDSWTITVAERLKGEKA